MRQRHPARQRAGGCCRPFQESMRRGLRTTRRRPLSIRVYASRNVLTQALHTIVRRACPHLRWRQPSLLRLDIVRCTQIRRLAGSVGLRDIDSIAMLVHCFDFVTASRRALTRGGAEPTHDNREGPSISTGGAAGGDRSCRVSPLPTGRKLLL